MIYNLINGIILNRIRKMIEFLKGLKYENILRIINKVIDKNVFYTTYFFHISKHRKPFMRMYVDKIIYMNVV